MILKDQFTMKLFIQNIVAFTIASFFVNELEASTMEVGRMGKLDHHGVGVVQTIDFMDSVIFDLSQAVIIGGYVEFPVSIQSDDTIFALDFSIKYEYDSLHFDSIYDLTTYMQSFSYFNASDSTVRFTSSSMQPYDKHSSLVSIRFALTTGQMPAAVLTNATAYLNGDLCSVKIMDRVLTNIEEADHFDLKLKAYPVPGNEILTIEFPDINSARIINSLGVVIGEWDKSFSFKTINYNVSQLTKGIYYLQISGDSTIKSLPVFICNE